MFASLCMRMLTTKILRPKTTSNIYNNFMGKYRSATKKSLQQSSYFESRQKVYDKHDYPHSKPTISIPSFIQKYSELKQINQPTTMAPQQKLIGRITSIRKHGKTTFLDIREQHIKLQITIKTQKQLQLRRGDIISAKGNPFVTKKGQLSLNCHSVDDLLLLAPCMWMLPEYDGLKDAEARFRNKSLDLIVNHASMDAVKKRARIISVFRGFLEKQGFVEVETPILSPSCGGAIAKPFITYHNDHKSNLYLRIAPQLYLKKLLIGGLHKVFQIGKNFRNESIDQTHNPQFTSCQLYWAYEDYKTMITFTKDLILHIAKTVNGNTKVIGKDIHGKIVEIQLDCQWKCVDFIGGLEHAIGQKLRVDFEGDGVLEEYGRICDKFGVAVDEPRTIQRMLDKLAGKFLETTHEPFMIINHPKIMSPLAKPHPDQPHLTQRFQLFINGWEVVNSYTQLNDPRIQRENTPTDTDFVQALEYGLMPCAGWGIGLDRLIMILTNQQRIQQVIAFPLLRQMLNPEKPEDKQQPNKNKQPQNDPKSPNPSSSTSSSS